MIELQQSNLSFTITYNWLDNHIHIGTKYGTSSRGQTNSIVLSKYNRFNSIIIQINEAPSL